MSIQNKKILALIPARGGSKGLPRKNVLDLCGKPLIAWTVEAAKKCRYADMVAASTDDSAIADAAKAAGAMIPFMRPAELSTDAAGSLGVIFHAMEYFEKKGDSFDILVFLQPTSPLREARHVEGALDFFVKKNASAVLSVTEAEHPPQWTNQLPLDLNMKDFLRTEDKFKNRQALGKYYRLNGAIYIADWRFLKEKKDWFSESTFAYVMDRKASVDIDTEDDFKFAEMLIKENRGDSVLRCG